MLVGTLVTVLMVVIISIIRYALWKDKEIPEKISKVRWLIAFGATLIAIIIEVGAGVDVSGIILVLNGVLFLSVAEILRNHSSKSEGNEIIEYYCSECKASVDSDSKYCSSCGAEISEEISEDEINENLNCPNCGEQLIPGKKYCAECGIKL